MGYDKRTIRMTGLFLFVFIFPNDAEPVPRGTEAFFITNSLAALLSSPVYRETPRGLFRREQAGLETPAE